ncbi:MAG: nuclear transport factor 2 family protein [Novosphingobium sp.]|nr:nuclear transport factor 2 family protein [Novosphingobium sp.]
MDRDAVADEMAIRNLGAAYADACGRLCPEDVAALFAPDGAMGMTGGKTARGDKILRNFQIVLGRYGFLVQTLHSGLIVLDGPDRAGGDAARGRWWMSEVLKPRDSGEYRMNLGFYEDAYVRLDGQWRIASRMFTLRLSTPLPHGAVEGPEPAFAALPLAGLSARGTG